MLGCNPSEATLLEQVDAAPNLKVGLTDSSFASVALPFAETHALTDGGVGLGQHNGASDRVWLH